MTPEQRQHLRQLVKDDIGRWEDNLFRARLQARSMRLDTPYGGNGETLGDIIRGYESRRAQAQALLDQLSQPLPPTKE